jgi:4'-phosphopantetheinyl transferase
MPNKVRRKEWHPSHLKAGTIDLWRVDLQMDRIAIGRLFETLSDDEKERAKRFVFANDGERFVVGRGILRMILSTYLHRSPNDIEFSYGRFGKPFLKDQKSGVRFNVSHSKEVGIIAITLGREIGVDVEFVDHSFQFSDIARSVFSATDVARLEALPGRSRAGAFFSGWTRKEAVLKAIGDGLSSPDELHAAIPVMSEENAVSFRASFQGCDKKLSLVSLCMDESYRLALSVDGELGTVRFCELDSRKVGFTIAPRAIHASSRSLD